MELRPVIAAMRRNRVGALLIAMQIAVTLAVLCNAVYIVQQRLSWTARPSGVDEADVFVISNQLIGSQQDLGSRIQTDLAALRAVPGIRDSYASNQQPLDNGEDEFGITLDPDHPAATRFTTVYYGDQRALATLGLTLSAGRNFNASEIGDCGDLPSGSLGGALVTRELAKQLDASGNVLGRVATLVPISLHVPIVGVIDRLEAPNVDLFGGSSIVEQSIILSCRFVNSRVDYIVHAMPGRLAETMRVAPLALAAVSRDRVILSVRSLHESRREIYRSDRTIALMLTLVCIIIVAVAVFGIVGLTSYWVSQRRRQIGIRRALGATRPAIVRYFQTENFLIAAVGVVIGAVLAVGGNLWMVERFAMTRLPFAYPLLGIVAMLSFGQLAVLWPALRAASVPPAVAARGV